MELSTHDVKYSGPIIPVGMKSTVDEADLEILIIGARENIYSYPERTLIQEYVNNGKDANREAGNPDWKMNIHIPTRDKPIFICRDYGTGLSPESMEQVYRKTANSTKRQNKKLTGKYGIGSKIAFRYTDAFTVISYFNGMKYTYLAHKANTKIGEFIQTEAVPTEEENGVEIQVALKHIDHIGRFLDGIRRIFKYWEKKPTFNCNLAFSDPSYEDEFIVVMDDSGTGVLVDGTPYKIDLDDYNLDNSNSREVKNLLKKWDNNVYFKADLSDVEIPMNREYIANDDKIKNFFKNVPSRLKAAEAIILKKFVDKDYNTLNELKDAWENDVEKLVETETNYLVKKINRTIEISANGTCNLILKQEDSAIRIYDRESKSKFSITRTIRRNCVQIETYVTARLNKIFDRERSSTAFETSELPDGFKEFFQILTYEEAFPKGSSPARGYYRSEPLDKETFHVKRYNGRGDTSMKVSEWKEKNPNMDITIKYLPVVSSSFDREFAKTATILMNIDGFEGEVIGLSSRSATTLTKVGYKLEEVPRDGFVISEKMKESIRVCAYHIVSDTLWSVLSINPKKNLKCPDADVVELIKSKSLYEGMNSGWELRELAKKDYIAGMKEVYDAAEIQVKALRRRVIQKYPFLGFRSDYNNDYKGVNEWLFSNLIPLLYPQSMEQSKSLPETTDSV